MHLNFTLSSPSVIPSSLASLMCRIISQTAPLQLFFGRTRIETAGFDRTLTAEQAKRLHRCPLTSTTSSEQVLLHAKLAKNAKANGKETWRALRTSSLRAGIKWRKTLYIKIF